MMSRRVFSAALPVIAIVSFLFAGTARAQIVVPGTQANAEGNSGNAAPFSITPFDASDMRYQQVYGASAFGTPAGPLLITQISFRPDAEFGDAFAATLPSIRIDLSTTSTAVDAPSTTFADNVGANNLTIFNGALALSSSDTAAAGGSRAFDIVINLATSFLYDPAGGNLLLDVYNFGGGTTTFFDAQDTAGDAVSRVFTPGVSSPVGRRSTPGLVTRFTVAVVPEANTLALALPALGMVGAVVIRRRKPQGVPG